jgi:hypothetical protein
MMINQGFERDYLFNEVEDFHVIKLCIKRVCSIVT